MSNNYTVKAETHERLEHQLHLRNRLLEIEENRRSGIKDFNAKKTITEFRKRIKNELHS